MKPPAQLQSKEDPSSPGECDAARPPNQEAEAEKSNAKGCSALVESEEWQNSSVSSVWDSTVHESESLEACLGKGRELLCSVVRAVPSAHVLRTTW